MKPARRDLSIFNVSTIDLFASALGAFMVIAFVLLPYFHNTTTAPPDPDPPEPAPIDPAPPPPDPGSEEALQQALDELAEAEAAHEAARQEAAELRRKLAEAISNVQKLPPIDLVIALDTTGSMTGEVASLREEIAGLAELLVKLAEDAAVGIIDFKDRCDPRTALRVAQIRKIDPRSVRELTAFARSMRPGGSYCNKTAPEDFAQALRAALNLNWRPGAERHSIVMISDNPAHEDLQQQAIADAGRFAARPTAAFPDTRRTVSTVFVNTGDLQPAHPYRVYTVDFMQRVARAGQGEFVEARENASLSLTILHALFGD